MCMIVIAASGRRGSGCYQSTWRPWHGPRNTSRAGDYVLNKADLVEPDDAKLPVCRICSKRRVCVRCNGDGIHDLVAHVDRHLGKLAILVTVDLPPIDGAARAWLHQNAMVKSSHFDERGHERSWSALILPTTRGLRALAAFGNL